jgi:hypothetical protein
MFALLGQAGVTWTTRETCSPRRSSIGRASARTHQGFERVGVTETPVTDMAGIVAPLWPDSAVIPA